jgi:hypothetical protein
MQTLQLPIEHGIIERSERAILQEQLRNFRNLYKQMGNLIAQTERRLAEIERATVERERAEVAA